MIKLPPLLSGYSLAWLSLRMTVVGKKRNDTAQHANDLAASSDCIRQKVSDAFLCTGLMRAYLILLLSS